MPRYNKLWNLKIVGLMTSMAYMSVILYTWISAEMGGYTYFSAGEPHDIVRTSEWLLGILGFVMLAVITKEEIDAKYT